MRKVLVISIACALLLGAQFSAAEEDLFDSKAAVESLEKGLVQIRTKNIDAAIESLEESVSIAPLAEAYYYLGYAYYLKGRSGDSESRKLSIESFEKAYDLDPSFSPNRYKPTEADALEPGQPNTTENLQPDQPAQTPIEAESPVVEKKVAQQ